MSLYGQSGHLPTNNDRRSPGSPDASRSLGSTSGVGSPLEADGERPRTTAGQEGAWSSTTGQDSRLPKVGETGITRLHGLDSSSTLQVSEVSLCLTPAAPPIHGVTVTFCVGGILQSGLIKIPHRTKCNFSTTM